MSSRIPIVRCVFALLAATLMTTTMLRPNIVTAATGTITTVAGGGVGDGGPATNANLAAPTGVAAVGGSVYIADFSNCRIRKVSSGTITTVAGNGTCGFGGDGGPATSANLSGPSAVAVDVSGDLFIADTQNCRVREVSAAIITTVAGNAVCGYGGDGGVATNASLGQPQGVALDANGDLYIADTTNCRVRKVSGGAISTVVGNGVCGYGGDGGSPTGASLYFPRAAVPDANGDLWVADSNNCRIREVSGAIIDTVAGDGVCTYAGDGGAATSASLQVPEGIALDANGDLYIADSWNCRVRKLSGGNITTVAGDGACAYGGDGGLAANAELYYPSGVALDAGGLYIADQANCRVRKVNASMVTTIAGGTCKYSGDGGPATSASLNSPDAVAVDSAGDLYIADTLNCRVRKVASGTITTVAGNGVCWYGGDGGTATSASLQAPEGVAVAGNGDIYIADTNNCRVRKVSGTTITTVIGDGSCAYGGDGGPATSAYVNYPEGLAVDAAGNLYVAESVGCRIREVSGGIITTIAGNGACAYGGDGGPAMSASLSIPRSVAVDVAGNVYIADSYNCRVREVSGGIINTVAGDGACAYGGDGGPATSASLYRPWGISTSEGGDLYIADGSNCRVRKVSGGSITTIAGTGTCAYAGDGGPATSASLNDPHGLALDGGSNVYVADSGNNRIRLVVGVPWRDHKTDANGDGYSAADEATIANCGAASCSGIRTWGTSETKTCKDPGANCGSPGPPADDSVPVREGPPPADGYGCEVTLDTVGPKKTTKLAQSDIDLDGTVSILDLSKVATWFGDSINASAADPRWEGDFDGDGHISILDLSAMAANFGRSVANDCKIE
jgi:sugar lactone lactonase YvrE